MAVTMRDIAERCGLSRPTVTLALGEQAWRLRPETVARVREVASELGYRPNAAARAMRRGSLATVALLSSDAPGGSSIPPATIATLHDRLAADDFRLLLVRAPDRSFTAAADELPRVATEHCADAVILNRVLPAADPVGDALRSASLPAVWWNIERPHDAVRPDDEGAGRRAVAELLALGHRRIAYLNPFFTGHTSEPDRRRGFAAAMAEAGLPVEVHAPPDERVSASLGEDPLAWLVALLRRPGRPTALVLNGHQHAGWIYEAAARAGLDIPTDLSLVVIHGNVDAEWVRTASLVRVPEEALGAALAEMALAAIAAPQKRQPTVRLPFDWLPKRTTAPCAGR